MTREQLKGKQTPGEITTKLCDTYGPEQYEIHWSKDGECTAEIVHGEANAALYAEAHNVANKTGMWPEDMEASIKELEEALKVLRSAAMLEAAKPGPTFCQELRDALDMAEHILNKRL